MTTPILEEHGYFWWADEELPEGEFPFENSVSGVLKIDADGSIELDLNGFLPSKYTPIEGLLGGKEPSAPDKAIQGVLKDSGKYALLIGPVRSGGTFNSQGKISFEKYVAHNCLVGCEAFPKIRKEPRFYALGIDMEGFEEWFRLGAIETTRTKSKVTAKYVAPKDIKYPLEDGALHVRYDLRGNAYPGKLRLRNFSITEGTSFRFVPKKAVDLAEMRKQYGLLADLLVLLTGSDRCFGWPSLIYGKKKTSYKLYFLRSINSSPAPEWRKSWVNFLQIQESFGRIYSAWREKHAEFGPGIYLYLGTRRGEALYAEHRFVNLIWGLESLHRRKNTKSEMPAKFQEKIDRILEQIDGAKDRKWLKDRLQYLNEPPLGQRIFELFSDLPLRIDPASLKEFSLSCAQRRNDISHFGGQRNRGKENYWEFVGELDKKSEALSYLYHALLLREIGIPDKVLKLVVSRGFRASSLRSALNEVGLSRLPPSDAEQDLAEDEAGW